MLEGDGKEATVMYIVGKNWALLEKYGMVPHLHQARVFHAMKCVLRWKLNH